MSSRSRKSSTSIKISNNENDMSGTIIIVLYNLLIISYIIQLEDKRCGCITDWRHNFIKNFSFALIVWGIITFALKLSSSKNGFIMFIKNILMIAALINIWCLYTYVGDLDKTKCMCAIDSQKNMHYFLYLWRYVLVGGLIISLIGIISLTLRS
jgi:hypothetical protein